MAGVGLADVILSFHSILRSDVSSGASIESRYSASNIYTLVRGVGDNAAAVRASPVGRLSRFFVLGFLCSLERSALGRTASATRLRAAYQIGGKNTAGRLFVWCRALSQSTRFEKLTRHANIVASASKVPPVDNTAKLRRSQCLKALRTQKINVTPNTKKHCAPTRYVNKKHRSAPNAKKSLQCRLWTARQPSSAKK